MFAVKWLQSFKPATDGSDAPWNIALKNVRWNMIFNNFPREYSSEDVIAHVYDAWEQLKSVTTVICK